MPTFKPSGQKLADFYFIDQDEPEKVLGIILELVKQRITHRFGFDPIDDIQLLPPMHKGVVGAGNLNMELQQVLNPVPDSLTRGGRNFRLKDSASFVYFMGFLYFLVFGGLTGIELYSVSLDVHWQDTYFVGAHFHFIMVGGTIMCFLAGLHYWWPKMFGKVYSERWALAAAVLVILGFNATFIPQFLLGNMGMPRRYYSYPEQFQALNVASTAGASLLAFGFFIILFYLVASLVRGWVGGPNPWFSRGYEWNTPSPPNVENFPETPVYDRGPHEYQDGPSAEVKHAH